jgi:hypothetical protein
MSIRARIVSVLLAGTAGTALAASDPVVDIRDPHIKAWYDATPERPPQAPADGTWGLVGPNGSFVHPTEAPKRDDKAPRFPGERSDWDSKSYAKNMKVEAFYPLITEPYHSWQATFDMNGRRYMYHNGYLRGTMKIYDITDPKNLKVLRSIGPDWTKDGPVNAPPLQKGEMFGAATIQWDAKRGKYVMVQDYEVRRFSVIGDKRFEPANVEKLRHVDHLRGFKVYEMNGPLPEDWTLIAQATTDVEHPDAPVEQQQGSGALDVPVWFGGKYMFLAAAPDDRYALTEYPSFPYSAAHQAWDMSDPAHPKFVGQLTVPGQIAGDPAHEAAYRDNPRAGNRTTWMGARMALFLPKPVEQGGKIGYAAMGGLGFYTVDVSDPAHMRVLGHLDFPVATAGTEGDNIDVSQVEKTGLVYMSGYAVNSNCYEAYQHIYVIDVKDPAHPKQVGTLPRPMPPKEAGIVDYCQRQAVFGPKRSGYYTQPGRSKPGILPYAFQTAGVQIFDVRDPKKPSIAAYFVPGFRNENLPPHAWEKLAHGIYVEYDRNLLWLFTDHGVYLLSSPVLGKPNFGAPAKPWPART